MNKNCLTCEGAIPAKPKGAVGSRTTELLRTLFAIVTLCSANAGFAEDKLDDRPLLHETPARLVEVIDSMGRANFAAASIDVCRDVAAKKLRLCAIAAQTNREPRKLQGFEIEVIHNGELVADDRILAGSYHAAYNHQVFSFAIAEFATGRKELGLALVKLIAQVQPEFWWSSPTHSPIAIKSIVIGLEKDDESVRDLVKFESEQWANTTKKYGTE